MRKHFQSALPALTLSASRIFPRPPPTAPQLSAPTSEALPNPARTHHRRGKNRRQREREREKKTRTSNILLLLLSIARPARLFLGERRRERDRQPANDQGTTGGGWKGAQSPREHARRADEEAQSSRRRPRDTATPRGIGCGGPRTPHSEGNESEGGRGVDHTRKPLA